MRAVIRNGPVAQHKQTELGRDLSGSTLGSNEDFGARNKRSVWEVTTQPFSEAHFATFPPALIEPCILAGCPVGGTVLDPFFGAGTTGLVADRLGRGNGKTPHRGRRPAFC
jgi:DNA modification methylase